MTELKTEGGYFTLDHELAKLEREYQWARRVESNRAQLEQIADIVRLGVLWADPRFWGDEDAPTLQLKYYGEAKNHVEAAADLSRIMEALGVQELKLGILGGGDTYPHGEYKGVGKLGELPVEITLDVRWLPETCRVEVSEPRRTWSTTRQYYAYCRR